MPSQTKMIATLGPATSSKAVISQLIEGGVDVFRINFSHASQEKFLERISIIKELNRELETHVAVLADLQGPKLRVGEIENDHLLLEEDDVICFVTEKCLGCKDHIYMSYEDFPKDVSAGETILIDDGNIELKVLETDGLSTVKAKVIYGGILSSKKGVNLPNTKISLPCLTEDDISNAVFALKHDVDWIALSFVRKASDILELKNLIKKQGGTAGVIAKIEKPQALMEIDEIIAASDGIMVARGDLGVETAFDKVPLMQKMIVDKCIETSKPVIIATQMMESMISHSRPTRAEAADVANAVLDGADTLMLSGETSIGRYPVETIQAMEKIIRHTESLGNPFDKLHEPVNDSSTFHAASICLSAAKLAKQVNAKAMIVFTHSGYSAIRVSSHRPEAGIFAFTDNHVILNRLSLVWGIQPFFMDTRKHLDQAFEEAVSILKTKKLLSEGDCVVIVASTPLACHAGTNMVKVSYI